MAQGSEISREGLKEYPCQLDLDDEDSAPLRADAEKALNLIRAFKWGAPVRVLCAFWGVGGLIVAFTVFFDRDAQGPPAHSFWVVVGDVPSAVFADDMTSEDSAVVEAAVQRMDRWAEAVIAGEDLSKVQSVPEFAVEAYCQKMDKWIAAVRADEDLAEFAPMDLEPTPANAAALEAKIKFIRDELLSAYPMDFLGARENESWLPEGMFWPYARHEGDAA